jgi:glycosyltransferase A (GT-A) superfamily protein (DUF2064 family)
MRRVPQAQRGIAYLPAAEKGYFDTLAPDFELILQNGPDLGIRLDNVLTHYLNDGYQHVVVMDSDSPTLPPGYLTEAFTALAGDADVVLGPCNDGGYYLIGLKHPAPRLLREVRMSTPNVTTDTLALAAEEGLRVELLPEWYDVDDAAALARLTDEVQQSPAHVAHHTRAALLQTEFI